MLGSRLLVLRSTPWRPTAGRGCCLAAVAFVAAFASSRTFPACCTTSWSRTSERTHARARTHTHTHAHPHNSS